jgi:hypothetical protein
MHAQEQAQRSGGRKLGRAAEAAVARVVARAQLLGRRAQQVERDRAGRRAFELRAHGRRQLPGLRVDARTIFAEHLGDAREQGREARPPVGVARREVGAGEERALIGRQEHRHRPAAVAAHGDRGCHVHTVEIGALFAVNLDAHEVLVHQGGDLLVLERLALHHVAPMAGRVADAQQDGLVLAGGARQGLFAPGIPGDRVVRVLQQVWAGLADQPVRLALSAGHALGLPHG